MSGMVPPEGLSPDVVQFVSHAVDSIEQLELLAMLVGSSGRWWNAASAGAALGVSSGKVQHDLECLATRNLLAVKLGNDVSYRFDPGSPALRAVSQTVVAAYRNHPQALFRLVAARQNRAVREFADAFRIRRK
jgi:hypothetical protein